MWGSIGFGFACGMAIYIAIGGEHYFIMTAILIPSALFGVWIADRVRP